MSTCKLAIELAQKQVEIILPNNRIHRRRLSEALAYRPRVLMADLEKAQQRMCISRRNLH
jgi:hypothetical protein